MFNIQYTLNLLLKNNLWWKCVNTIIPKNNSYVIEKNLKTTNQEREKNNCIYSLVKYKMYT